MTTESIRREVSRKLYANAKQSATDRLGGDRAWVIQAPTIRRMAIADAILVTLNLQDESISDTTVRDLMADMFELLTYDAEHDWL